MGCTQCIFGSFCFDIFVWPTAHILAQTQVCLASVTLTLSSNWSCCMNCSTAPDAVATCWSLISLIFVSGPLIHVVVGSSVPVMWFGRVRTIIRNVPQFHSLRSPYEALRFANAVRKFEQVNSILADVTDGDDVPSSLPPGSKIHLFWCSDKNPSPRLST